MSFRFKTSGKDEWYTPVEAVEYILPYIEKGKTIWCPFDKNESNFVKVFKEKGYHVINTHIEYGQDFLVENVPKCDYIISNPPFSLRDEILERLFEINVPFAMILNINGMFDSKKRYDLLMHNKFELLIPRGRIKFFNDEFSEKNTSPNFQSVYLCSSVLDKQIVFVDN